MVTVSIASFILLALISFAIYRWQRPTPNENVKQVLPPSPPDYKSLFAPDAAEEARISNEQSAEELAEKRRTLLQRAATGDKAALDEAHESDDKSLYDEVLNALVERAGNDKQLLALASYISRTDSLPVNKKLAEAFMESWKVAPDRHATAKMLHLSAMANDATVYLKAIEIVLQYWRERRLSDINASELAQLIESEFWIIPDHARNSGAGFPLKRKLANVRRDLAATTTKQG